MKTVGDFLSAGLSFVEGDCVSDYLGGEVAFLDECDKNDCNEHLGFSLSFVTKFAWRENTGVKPEFSGLIDVKFSTGTTLSNYDKNLLGWKKAGAALPIIEWRPSLNQPSVIEPDTKESEIHKAWVALKGDLNNVIDDIQGSKDSILKCISGIGSFSIGDYAFCVGNFHNKSVWEYVCTKQEFTDYCVKMAAEEKRMDIIGQNGNDGLHYDNTAQQVESLAVNDKPIFTQAMACAGEFPLIGAKCVYVFMENGSEYTGSIAAIDGNVIWFKLDGGGYKTCFGVHKFKAVDNRTDREKAIDEMLELDLWATDREFLEAIYDAGYRKC